MTATAHSTDVFRAIADPTRRSLLALLHEGERPATELAAHFRISQPAVSQQLAVLRSARLVSERRQGRQRLYRIDGAPLREVADWLAFYERFWRGRLDRLGRYLDRMAASETSAAARPARRVGAKRPRGHSGRKA